ncbi:unnamed protein product, partial [Tetraodon nigroviridis]
LHLVALNQPHSGDMTGPDAADRMCHEQAEAMGLPPNYRAFVSSHRRDLVHAVYPGFRETLPVTNLRGDVMFRNWRSIFNGDGGPIGARVPVYSFDGRDVLADPFWSVILTLWLWFPVFSSPLLHLCVCVSGPRRASGTAPPARHASDGQTLRDVANGPRVGGGPVVQPGRRAAPRPAAADCSNQYIVLCIETHKNL